MSSRTLTRLKPAPGYQPTAAQCDAYAEQLRDRLVRSMEARVLKGHISLAEAAQERAIIAIVIQAARARISDAVWFGGALN